MYLFSIAASTLDEQGLACTLFKANWAFSNEYKPSVSHHHHAVCSRCVHAAGLGDATTCVIPICRRLEIT
jgi:Fe2+ or Zn2+ uptake regulation protein